MDRHIIKAAFILSAVTVTGGMCSAAESQTAQNLQEVVVTATRTAENVSDVPSATQVITQEDMKQMGAYDLKSALRLALNVDLSEAGMTGNEVMIRGMSTSHTLILIDGQRMAGEDTTETSNVYELNRISLSQVDRIEIVRGPSSALYGSDAMGGVINIITKKPQQQGGLVGVSSGTRFMNNYYHYDLGQQGKFNASFNADFSKVRKYMWDTGNSSMYGPRQNYSFQGEYKLSPGRTVNLNAGWMKDHMRMTYADAGGVTGKYQNIDSSRQNVGIDYHGQTSRSDFMVRAYYNQLEKKNNTYQDAEQGPAVSDFDRARYRTFVLDGKDTTRLSSKHQLTAGGEYRYLDYRGTRLDGYGDNAREIHVGDITKTQSEREMHFSSFYVQDEWIPTEKLLIIPSVRYDYSSQFGSYTAPKIGLTYKIEDHLRMKVNYGRGFRAPTLSELYMYFDGSVMMTLPPGVIYIVGNPDLQPEKSLGYDVSLEGEWGRNFGKVTWFHNHVNNLISYHNISAANESPMILQYYNVGSARLQGVEAEVGRDLTERWTLKGTWNYLDAWDEEENTRLNMRARHYGTVQLLYNDRKENGISGVLWLQFTNDYLYNSKNYSYRMLNISLNKKWNQQLSTFVGIDNLLNKNMKNLYISGRMWRAGAEWKF